MNKKDYIKIQNDIDTILGNNFSVEYIHGALTAILCAPEIIPPSEWLPVLTMKDGEEVEFKSNDDAKSIMGSFLGLYNEIAQSLGVDDFYPLYSHNKPPGEKQLEADPATAKIWCNGFIGGLGLWHTDFVPDEKAREILMPVFILVDSSVLHEDNMEIPEETIKELEKVSVSTVAEAVKELSEYYKLRPKPDKKRIGRNEQCPCGSGKKYKKCCGIN